MQRAVVEIQKKENYSELFLDGVFISKISKSFLKEAKSPLTFENKQAFESWFFQEERQFTLKRAMLLLSKRFYPSDVLKEKLRESFLSEPSIHFAIEKMKQAHYLDDASWIDSFIEKELLKGHGPYLILAKLKSKKISMSEKDLWKKMDLESQQRAIKGLVEKKLRKLSSDKRKLFRALAQRGFENSAIYPFCQNGAD